MAQVNGFDLGGYRLALGAAGLRLTHGERPMLDLPGDFVVARRGRAWSPEVTPYSGSVNLRHEVDSEARSIGSPRAMQEDSGALVLAGDLSDGGTWQLRLWPDAEGVGFTLEAAGYDEVGFCFAAAAGERFMGFGEQFTYLDMSGKAFALCDRAGHRPGHAAPVRPGQPGHPRGRGGRLYHLRPHAGVRHQPGPGHVL